MFAGASTELLLFIYFYIISEVFHSLCKYMILFQKEPLRSSNPAKEFYCSEKFLIQHNCIYRFHAIHHFAARYHT